MHRSLLVRSIVQPFRKSRVPESGRKNVTGKLEALQTFTTLNGQGYLDYGREPVKVSSVQTEIVNALRLGERSIASHLLSDFCCGNQFLRADDFVYILGYCARSPDPLFVMETWKTMEEKAVNINSKCYFLIIRGLCKGGYLEEAFNLISSLGENSDIYPVLPMYNNFLGACADTHSVNHASRCLDLMEKQMVGKNEVTYAELLKLAVLQENLVAVHGILKESTKYYNLSIISLRKFIWSFARLRDLSSAYVVLQHMIDLALRGGTDISMTTEGKLSTSRLDIPIPSDSEFNLQKCSKDNETSLSSVVEHCNDVDQQAIAIFGIETRDSRNVGMNMLNKPMSGPILKILRWSFNDLIHVCAQTQNCGLAEHLILQMQNLGVEPSARTYDGLIRVLVKNRGFNDGVELLKVMQKKNVRPCDSTLASISISCSKELELDLAEAFLDQICHCPFPYPYNHFLEACAILDQPERAVGKLAKMRQMRIQPDIRTYELMFSLFGNVNAPYEDGNILSQVDSAKRISAIEADMFNNGIQHSFLSIRNLLRALGTEGMIKELIQYFCRAENQYSHHNTTILGIPIYNTVLHSLVEAKESHMAIEMFKTMIACEYRPDVVTYNIMINCCSIIRCFRSAGALVAQMIRDGFYPQVLTYTALIKILLENEDFDGALNLVDQGCSEEIQLDVLLFNTILQAACDKGRLDIIEFLVEKMHEEKIHPDPSTCGYVFSAYVDHGFYSTAVEALQVLSMRMILSDDDSSSYEETRSKFEEDFILADDLEAELRIIELFKDSKENLAVGLLNLRWCAIVGYPISWVPNRSLWSRRLSNTYGSLLSTPCQFDHGSGEARYGVN